MQFFNVANYSGLHSAKLLYKTDPGFIKDNWKHFLVNHCAAVKKLVWERVKFNEQIFASEDKVWSLETLKEGYNLLYNVPCYYLYTKPFSRDAKIKRAVIEQAA